MDHEDEYPGMFGARALLHRTVTSASSSTVGDRARSVYVWVDAWEQQCCGEPFRTGGTVAWEANQRPGAERVAVRVGAEWADRIGFAQEHHGDDPEGVLTGTIARIEAVACRRERHERRLDLVPGSGQLHEVPNDVAWVPPTTRGAQVWMHEGWIVELRSAGFRRA
jgi:hypothetical protein